MTYFERPNGMTFASQASTGAFYDRFLRKLETVLTDQQGQITDMAQVQADLASAQAAIADQLTQIIAAQAAADSATRNDAISSSWTSPGSILSASDAGTDATVAVAAHSRKYGDASTVSVDAGTVTALAYTTKYYIYYDQPDRSGGTVAYQATTNPNTALPNAAEGRHFCGEIDTPASGGGATTGGVSPPGAGGGIPDTDVP